MSKDIEKEMEVITRVVEDAKSGQTPSIMQDRTYLSVVGDELVEGDRGLLARSPARLRSMIQELDREKWFQPEAQLEVYARPDAFVNRVRMAFWNEWEKSMAYGLKIDISAIAHNANATEGHMWAVFRHAPWLMWVLTPPVSYTNFLDEALERGLSRIRSIIDAKLGDVDPTSGRLIIQDHKAAELVLKAVAFLDLRRNGGIVERSENKHVHLHASSSTTSKALGTMTAGDVEAVIDAKIRALEVGSDG